MNDTSAFNSYRETQYALTHDTLTSKFPVEIVSHIFAKYVEDSVPPCLDEGVPSQFLLGAVSTTWRTISWSTPELWNSFSLSLCKVNTRTVDILREWLPRSGVLSLYLKLNLYHKWAGCTHDQSSQRAVIDLLVCCKHRWSFLELMGHVTDLFPSVYSEIAHSTTLHTLILDHTSINSVLYLRRIRNLRILSLPDDGLVFAKLQHIDWSGLKHFRSTFQTVDMLWRTFTRATSLTHFTFELPLQREGEYDAHPEGPIICQGYLSTLSTTGIDSYWSANRVLLRLQLPALEHLLGPWHLTPSLLDLIRRSSCSLKTLELVIQLKSPDEERQLVGLLSEIPTLEILRLTGYCINGSIDPLLIRLAKTAMIQETSKTSFLPNLTSMTLDSVKLSWACIYDLLSTHSSGPTTSLPRFHRRGLLRPLMSLQIELRSSERFEITYDIAQKLLDAIQHSTIQVTISTSGLAGCCKDVPMIDFLFEYR